MASSRIAAVVSIFYGRGGFDVKPGYEFKHTIRSPIAPTERLGGRGIAGLRSVAMRAAEGLVCSIKELS